MDVDSLRWFQLVADGTTVTEVSEVFGVSQPSVSRALARLEDEVGTALLERQGRVLRMTLAGLAFKRYVDQVVNAVDDGLATVEQLVDPERGVVSLGFPLSLGTWLVPTLIRQFERSHPSVQFVLEATVSNEDNRISPLLASGRIDLELTTSRAVGPHVLWHPLLTDELYLALPDGHPLAAAEAVDLRNCRDERLVLLRSPSRLRRITLEIFHAVGVDPDVAFEADDLATVRGFVGHGLGISILPSLGAAVGPVGTDGVVLRPLAGVDAVRHLGLAWTSHHPLLPSANLFRRFVIDWAAGPAPARRMTD
ncbi:LysR family transcriptional regulator [Nostocoides sp. F2B08]|uniref:LysR family transcriptional regulator n=1 Tax=Nostocoides sp. F2B08 TaxID=2653936 RepID=UPI00186B1B1A|nr:LysR family transcriptional regulator [Tetrasphaera sp. F2B08]